jgi:phospholipase C
VNRQLYGDEVVPQPGQRIPDPAPMDGFVRDYIREWTSDPLRRPDHDDYARIMHCFPPEATPVTSGLAQAFAVSDAWFASVPSQTFCNRSFLHSAQSHGFVNNSDYVKWNENDAPTVFDRLTERCGAGRDWRIYWDPEDLVPIGVRHREVEADDADRSTRATSRPTVGPETCRRTRSSSRGSS